MFFFVTGTKFSNNKYQYKCLWVVPWLENRHIWRFQVQNRPFWVQIWSIFPSVAPYSDKNQLESVNLLLNQTYLPINNHFGGRYWFFARLLSDFWTTSPQFGYFRAQISPIFAPGGSENLQNIRKFVNSLCNQTYLTIINRLGRHMHIFGTLLTDFWSSNSNIGHFWAQISPNLVLGRSQNLQNLPKLKFSGRIS